MPHLLPAGLPLELHVLVEPLLSALSPEAALLVASKPGRRVEVVVAVDPEDAGLHAQRGLEGEAELLRPNPGAQAVAGVVGQLNRLVGSAEGLRRAK